MEISRLSNMCCVYTTVLTQPPKTIENENCVHTAVCTQFSMVLGGWVNTVVYTQLHMLESRLLLAIIKEL